jgi:alpha-L-fucosidase
MPKTTRSAPDSEAAYVMKYFNRVKDVVDQYHPDLIFFDDPKLPLSGTGLNLAAHFYNASQKWHKVKLQAVIVADSLSVMNT